MSEGKTLIGVDVGSSAIKVCQIKESRKGYGLLRLGYAPLPAQSIVDGHVMNATVVVEAIQQALGSAKIKQKEVAVSISGQHNPDGQLLLRVAANGAGFEPAMASRLFQPFQRLHRDTEFHGTGIGLTIVRRIVQRHGGTITARGTPGVGAVFEFTLGQREAGDSEPVQPTPRGEAPHPLPEVG